MKYFLSVNPATPLTANLAGEKKTSLNFVKLPITKLTVKFMIDLN